MSTENEIRKARIELLAAMIQYMKVTGTRTFQLSDLGIVDPMHTVDPMSTST
jgi:hypothetical protein